MGNKKYSIAISGLDTASSDVKNLSEAIAELEKQEKEQIEARKEAVRTGKEYQELQEATINSLLNLRAEMSSLRCLSHLPQRGRRIN